MQRGDGLDTAREGRRAPAVIEGVAKDITGAVEASWEPKGEDALRRAMRTSAREYAARSAAAAEAAIAARAAAAQPASAPEAGVREPKPATKPFADASSVREAAAAGRSAGVAAPLPSGRVKAGMGGRIALVALLLAGLAGAGFYVAQYRPDLIGGEDSLKEAQRAMQRQVAAKAAPPAPDPQVTNRLDAISNRLDALQDRMAHDRAALDKLASSPAPDRVDDGRMSDIAGKLDQIATRLTALEARLDAPKNDARAPLEPRENAAVAPPAPDVSAARLALAQNLAQSLAAGAPLGVAVSALRASGANAENLAVFDPYLDRGAPTNAALAARWSELHARIVEEKTVAPPASDGSWSGDLMARLSHAVKITRLGAASPAAGAYDSIAKALQHGDLAGAVARLDSLPESARAAAADWASAARARLQADSAARSLVNEAVAAVAKNKS